MMEQRVDKGAIEVASRRVHDEAGGFHQHCEMGILVEDFQWYVLRDIARRSCGRLSPGDDIAAL